MSGNEIRIDRGQVCGDLTLCRDERIEYSGRSYFEVINKYCNQYQFRNCNNSFITINRTIIRSEFTNSSSVHSIGYGIPLVYEDFRCFTNIAHVVFILNTGCATMSVFITPQFGKTWDHW